jgi:hypothetical protein
MPVAVSVLLCSVIELWAQAMTVNKVGENVTVKAPGIGFIKGDALGRLKDGREVRVDLELDVLPGPGGTTAAETRQTFVLSYDLWEERFAVTQVTTPPRSITYLTASGAESWCVEQLAIPVSALGHLGRDPFWARLGYRVDAEGASTADASADFSLRGLIDALSRKRKADASAHWIEAGPFRIGR